MRRKSRCTTLAFPDLLEVSIELHFKAGLARAAEKALTNPKEPLCTIFEVPVKDSDDDDDESIDEGSDIGDNSNSDEEESESETEEEENEEDEPPTKKKK